MNACASMIGCELRCVKERTIAFFLLEHLWGGGKRNRTKQQNLVVVKDLCLWLSKAEHSDFLFLFGVDCGFVVIMEMIENQGYRCLANLWLKMIVQRNRLIVEKRKGGN